MGTFWQAARARGGHVLALLCLAVMHAKLCYGLDRATDINAWDEGHYLRVGVELLQTPAPVDGLFYYVWYFYLHQLIADPVALYVGNNALLLGAPAYLLYALSYRLGGSRIASFSAAGLFLISPANTVTWPYITRFALCLVLACALALTVPLSRWARAALVVSVSFVLGYVRPEYMALFVLAWLVALVVSLAWARASPRRSALVLLLLAAVAALALALGNPYSLSRSRIAFSQHFALTQSRSGAPSGFSPWRDAGQIMRRHFGLDAASLGEALRTNPGAVLRHVGSNAVATARAADTQLLPAAGMSRRTQAALVQVGLLFLGLCWWRRGRRHQLQAIAPWAWIFLSAHALIGLGSALILYPRDHYLLIPACVGFLWAAELVHGALPALLPRAQIMHAAAVGGGLLWLTPFQLFGPSGLVPHAPLDLLRAGEPSLRNRMREIAALPARRRLHLLSAYPELPVFLPQQLVQSRPFLDAAAAPLAELLEREQIELVWWDDELTRAHRFIGDPELQRFADEPERYGFSARATRIPGERLYVRRGVLHD